MQSKHYICENLVRRFQPRFDWFLKSFWFWCESTLLCCWWFGEICKYWVENPLESSVPRIIRLLCVLEVQVQPEKKNNINDGWERNKIELIYQSFWISNTTQQGCLGLCTKATRSDGWLVLCLVSLKRIFFKTIGIWENGYNIYFPYILHVRTIELHSDVFGAVVVVCL